MTANNGSAILGRADLAADLRAMGVEEGDGLFVHTSLGKIGTVIGGPRGLIEALIEAVGETGLIAMPGFSRDAYDPVEFTGAEVSSEDHQRILDQVPGFDPARSDVAQNGAVPEAFRGWPGVVRSPHPTSSVLMYGPDVAKIAARHDPQGWATGPTTPWGRLRTRPQMKILLIGVRWNRCSALHAAESIAVHRRTKTRRFKLDGAWVEAPDVADDLGTLFPLVGQAWEDAGGVGYGKLGGADCLLTAYDPLVVFASGWLSERNKADGVQAAV